LYAAQKDPICIVGTGSNKIGEAEQNGGSARIIPDRHRHLQ